MVDQIKSKLNSLSSSGSNNAVRTDTKHAKASVQKVDPTRTKVDVKSVFSIIFSSNPSFSNSTSTISPTS